MNDVILKKYPQFQFIGKVYMFDGKQYIRAEYKDDCLCEAVGNYYYCIEDDHFTLTDDFREMVEEFYEI